MRLARELKIGRSGVQPAFQHAGTDEAAKGVVHLNTVQARCVVFEKSFGGKILRIEIGFPCRIGKSRCTCEKFTRHDRQPDATKPEPVLLRDGPGQAALGPKNPSSIWTVAPLRRSSTEVRAISGRNFFSMSGRTSARALRDMRFDLDQVITERRLHRFRDLIHLGRKCRFLERRNHHPLAEFAEIAPLRARPRVVRLGLGDGREILAGHQPLPDRLRLRQGFFVGQFRLAGESPAWERP